MYSKWMKGYRYTHNYDMIAFRVTSYGIFVRSADRIFKDKSIYSKYVMSERKNVFFSKDGKEILILKNTKDVTNRFYHFLNNLKKVLSISDGRYTKTVLSIVYYFTKK